MMQAVGLNVGQNEERAPSKPSAHGGPKEVREFEAPRFDAHDTAGLKQFFEDEGYVVVKAAVDKERVELAKGLMWDYLERAAPGVSREDPQSWANPNWPARERTGIMFEHGIGQSELNWTLRAAPDLKTAFAGLWDDHDLIVSFDGANVFRPWRNRPEWKTKGGWYHVDQNGLRNAGLQTIQGLVTLLPVNATTGGFVVVPRSHKHHAEICERHSTPEKIDFVLVPDDDPVWGAVQPLLLKCEPGDLVLWDSRTIHCNAPGKGGEAGGDGVLEDAGSLLRMVSYICLVPRAMASDEVLEQRKEAVQKGATTTHWPNRCVVTDVPSKWKPLELTPEQLALV